MKHIFGNARYIHILINFLEIALELPKEEYAEITIEDPHFRAEKLAERECILDVKIRTKSQKVINIEIQLIDEKGFDKRLLYYATKMYQEQLKSGEKYEEIRPVIVIAITDFNLIQDSSAYHHRYYFCDEKQKSRLSKAIEINTLELSKLPKHNDGTALYDWLNFLKIESEGDLEMLAKDNKAINDATVILREMSADEETRRIAEIKDKNERDLAWRLQNAYDDGEELGIRETWIEAAKKLLKQKMSIEMIMEVTGLTEEEIRKLQ